jgi:hypothetical protein
MARAERGMGMATKRAMASNDNNDDHDNNNDRDNNYNQDNSGNKDNNANNDNNNDKDDNSNDNEDKDGAAVATGSFVSGGSVSGGNHDGVGCGGFGRWRVVAVVMVSVVAYSTAMAMSGVHNNHPKEGPTAKMSATEAQATTSRCNKRIRGRHTTNASAMAAWRQWQQC